MSIEHKENNDVDEIFKKAIEPVNTEPSEEFWRKAAEGVISRGGQLKDGNALRWRIIAFILGAGLLLLGYFTYKIESGLKIEEQQITQFKKGQIQFSENGNANTGISSAAKDNANNSTSVAVKNSISNKENDNPETENKSTKYTSHPVKAQKTDKVGNASRNRIPNLQATVLAFNKKSHQNKQRKRVLEPVENDMNNSLVSVGPKNEISNSGVQSKSTDNLSPAQNSSVTQQPVQTNSGNINSSTPVITLPANKPALTTSVDTPKITKLSIDSASSRFSISAYFSPDYMLSYKFKTNNSLGDQIENAIKTGEKQTFSYTTGVKADYAFSSHFSISAGIAYESFSFNANPGYVYAQKQPGGDVGYTIPTSSGVVTCPYYGTTYVGDSLKMNITSTRTYLEIPVRMKYFFCNNSKFGLCLTGGVEANILLGEETYMNWQDIAWNETGTATSKTAIGSENMYFSYYLGLEGNYRIWNRLSIYAEPGLHNAVTPINNNTDIVSYPRLFSITGGLTYHL